MKNFLTRAMLALSSAAAIVAASCSGDPAFAQVINPSQPATGVPVAGTGISVAGQTVSVNYGAVANTSLQGNALHAPTAIGDTTPNTAAFTTLSATGAVSGAGFSSLFASPFALGSTAPNTGAFTTLSATGAVSGAGITSLFASPPAIGSTAAGTGAFTSLSSSGTISGTGFSNYLASPPTIGGTVAGSGFYTSLSANSILKAYKPITFGNYENAAANSITANSGVGQSNTNTQVNGTNAQGMAQSVLPFDHVGQYISNYAFTPVVTSGSTTYTATTISDAAITTANTTVGMFIQTLHATYFVGQVQSVVNGTATVDGWYTKSTGVASTPANSTGAVINPNSKVFGQNVVVNASGNGTTTGANSASGVEYDMSTGGTIGTPTSSAKPNVWGVDVYSMQYQYIDIGVNVRGLRNFSFYSNPNGGAATYGYVSNSDTNAVLIQDPTNNAINVTKTGASVFSVDPSGHVTNNGATDYGILPAQVTTTFTNVGPSSYTYGEVLYISGFNISGGATGQWIYAVRPGHAQPVLTDDGTGLTVLFQLTGNQLQIKTTSGTLQFAAKVITVF